MFETYSYLWSALALVLALVVPLAALRARARQVVRSGLLLVPFVFTSLVYVPHYWQPVRVAEVLRTGPEDLLIGFAAGAWIWIFAFGRSGPTPTGARPVGAVLRYLLIGVVGVGLSVGASMATDWRLTGWWAIASILLLGAILLRRHPRRAGCALRAAVGYGALHLAWTAAWLSVWPGAIEQWNPGALTGHCVGVVPVEEALWGVVTGFTWPLFLWEVLGPPRSALGGERPPLPRT